jgi:hypothetical protein
MGYSGGSAKRTRWRRIFVSVLSGPRGRSGLAEGVRRTLNQKQWPNRKLQLKALGDACDIRRGEDLTPAELKESLATLQQ